MGFGGAMILASNCRVKNGPGNDIKVWETTIGAQPVNAFSDRARVFASQTGAYFKYLGIATYDGSFDLGELPWAQFFMIIDMTKDDPNGPPLADGYDLDGIEILNGNSIDATELNEEYGWAIKVCGSSQGKTKDFSDVPAIRSKPEKAVGSGIGTPPYNFYSLGFGATICVKFDYAIFDRAGDDIIIYETMFGRPKCEAYPEKAEVAVSFDGITWDVVATGCQDPSIPVDIQARNSGIQYVRIKDISSRADFAHPKADGYDVDAVIEIPFLQGFPPCPDLFGGGRVAVDYPVYFDQTDVPDEIESLELMGNPIADQINLRFSMVAEKAELSIYNHLGRKISSQNLEGKLWDLKEISLPASHLVPGVYFVTLNSGVQKETIQFVKN